MKSFFIKIIPLTASVSLLSFFITINILAWTEPTGTPPNNNVYVPITPGLITQTKSGGLNLTGSLGVGTSTPQAKLGVYGYSGSWTTSGWGKAISLSNGTVIKWQSNSNSWRWGLGQTNGGMYLGRARCDDASCGMTAYDLRFDESGNSYFGNSITVGTNAGWNQMSLYPSVNDVYNPVTGASDRAHFHFGFTAVSGKEPLIETPSDLWVIGANHNTVADGYVKTNTGFCIGGSCCSSWSQCLALAGGSPFPSNTGCTGNPPSGKKIFVTSRTYMIDWISGTQSTGMANADNACQWVANTAGLGGTYRAFIYETTYYTPYCSNLVTLRNATDVVADIPYWNGYKKSDGSCTRPQVVANRAQFFTADGSGNFLMNPIRYNEMGQLNQEVYVFTNFKPAGGTWKGIKTCYTYSSCGTPTSGAAGVESCVYGDNLYRNQSWAGIESGAAWPCPAAACNTNKALYCVQQ